MCDASVHHSCHLTDVHAAPVARGSFCGFPRPLDMTHGPITSCALTCRAVPAALRTLSASDLELAVSLKGSGFLVSFRTKRGEDAGRARGRSRLQGGRWWAAPAASRAASLGPCAAPVGGRTAAPSPGLGLAESSLRLSPRLPRLGREPCHGGGTATCRGSQSHASEGRCRVVTHSRVTEGCFSFWGRQRSVR